LKGKTETVSVLEQETHYLHYLDVKEALLPGVVCCVDEASKFLQQVLGLRALVG
jgi:hypothetical protein